MSQLLIQQQKQLKASQILRTYAKQFIQLRNKYSDGNNGRCAIGAIMNIMTGDDGFQRHYDIATFCSNSGIPYSEIFRMNDGGKSFDEIADYLESINK